MYTKSNVSQKADDYLHINTCRAGLSLVTTLHLGLGSSGRHRLIGPDWRGTHDRIHVADLAGHLQLVTDSLSLRTIFGALLRLVHLDNVPGLRISAGIFKGLLLYGTQLLPLGINLSTKGLTLACTTINMHLVLVV